MAARSSDGGRIGIYDGAGAPSQRTSGVTLFAQRLGFDGFDRLKKKFADTIGERPESFARHAEELLARCEAEGDAALIGDTTDALIDALDGQLNDLASPSAMAALAAAADVMVEGEGFFVSAQVLL